MDLQEIRSQIDDVDKELVQCLERRMTLDTKREQILLEKVAGLVVNDTYRSTISAIFADILKHSRNYQRRALDGD